MDTIRIASYNISHCVDYLHAADRDNAFRMNLGLYADVIRELDADVIGLNEVYSVGEEDMTDQTGKIAAACRYPYVRFARGFLFAWGSDIGNAVLSRFPILSEKTVPVPAPVGDERRPDENDWYEDRVILSVTADVNGTPVRFIATHFGLNLQEKERMMARLLPLLDEEKTPTVLMGDFNAEPDDPVIAPLYERLTCVSRAAGNNENTFCAWNPYIHIDYFFVSGDLSVVDYGVCRRIASDHFPIYATLRLH